MSMTSGVCLRLCMRGVVLVLNKDNRNTLDELMTVLRTGETSHGSSCSLKDVIAGSDKVYLFRYGPIGGSNHVKDTWRIGIPFEFF